MKIHTALEGQDAFSKIADAYPVLDGDGEIIMKTQFNLLNAYFLKRERDSFKLNLSYPYIQKQISALTRIAPFQNGKGALIATTT